MSPFVDDLTRREHDRAFYNGVIITSICVAAGAGLATWLIPAAETPPNVAQAYLEARFARDWAAAWDLLCRPARSSTGGYQAYEDASDYWFRRVPRDVEVSTDRVRGVQAPGRPVIRSGCDGPLR